MRLFVAVNLPAGLKHEIVAVTTPLRSAGDPFRWVDAEALHLTLSFLGEVAESRVETLMDTLRAVAMRHEPFVLAIGRLGAFPNLRRPRVLWMGTTGADALVRLQADTAAALEPLGFPPEKRAYSPHLTLARARNDARPAAFATLESRAARIDYENDASIESLDLMRSHLSRAGARYERIGAAKLGASVASSKGI